jgi:hypothetical protein
VTKRRAVVVRLAPDLGAARVEVCVDVDTRERTVALRERAQHGEGDRVITADDERHGAGREDVVELRLDEGPRRPAVEG